MKYINSSSQNKNSNSINEKNLIKNHFSLSENKNIDYNTNLRNSKAYTPQKIIKQLQREELDLKRNLSKLVQKEKNIKEKSYFYLNQEENSANINPEQNKEIFKLKQISENKEIYTSQLNDIKFRINLLHEKYIKESGVYNSNCKEKMENFFQNQLNIKHSNKINSRLKELQIQSQMLISKIKDNAQKELKEKEELIKQQEKLEIENNKNYLEKIRKEEKDNIKKRKNNSMEEIKRMKECINKKLVKVKKNHISQKIKETMTTENTNRKNLVKSSETTNDAKLNKNYQIFKLKKNLALDKKPKILKKSWSERGLLLPQYKSEFSVLFRKEEKDRNNERKKRMERKTEMKIKQIKYSKKYEDHMSSKTNQHNSFNKNINNNYINVNGKFNYMNNYCNLIRSKIPTNRIIELQNPLKLKKNHIDLTKRQNSMNVKKLDGPNLKLPNLILNNVSKNKEKIYPKLSKNNNLYNYKSKEIQNIIEKNGIDNATLNIINSKLEKLNQKKEQKDLVLKYQGGFASNPDLGQEVSDILIDSIEAKMNIIEGIQNMKNDKNSVDKRADIKENEEENEDVENLENKE